MNADPQPGTLRFRPALPLTVLLLLALAVWGLALWHRGGETREGIGPPRVGEDAMAVELRRFRSLVEPKERVRAITRLGPIRDPRVTVALMEVVQTELEKDWTGATDTPPVLLAASVALFEYHTPESERVYGVKYWTGALMWWETHEAEIHQPAASLPR